MTKDDLWTELHRLKNKLFALDIQLNLATAKLQEIMETLLSENKDVPIK